MAKDPKNFLLGPRGAAPKKNEYVEGLVYHATPSSRVDKIKQEGILPQKLEDRQWNKPSVNDFTNEHVFAFAHPHGAFAHATRQAQRTGEPQSVLAVKVPTRKGTIGGGWTQDLLLHDGNRFRDDLAPIKKKGGVPPRDIVDVHEVKDKSR